MRFVLCQISNNLINPPQEEKSLADRYYDSIYTQYEGIGYYRPEHFWELPLWIAEMSYTIQHPDAVELLIITDKHMQLPTYGEPVVFCFSVLDANKNIIDGIIKQNYGRTFCLGGYISDGAQFAKERVGTYWFDSIKEFAEYWFIQYRYGTDWSLFEGERCIPRLTMSYGCTHRCKFCTVPNVLTKVSEEEILQQVEALKPLKFKLVYINDKTFGQAGNHNFLKDVREKILEFNPEFNGFIVQTSVQTVLSANLWRWREMLGIKIVELGIETMNDSILRSLKKPSTEKMARQAVFDVANNGMSVIANVILGLPDETALTYTKTAGFLMENIKHLIALNIYTLALYSDSEIAKEIDSTSESDSDELCTERSFWSSKEKQTYDVFSEVFYEIGLKITEG